MALHGFSYEGRAWIIPGRRAKWLGIAFVYFAISMISVPEAGETTRYASAAGVELANRLASATWRDLLALVLSMLGMVLFIHGIFRTHPGRETQADRLIAVD